MAADGDAAMELGDPTPSDSRPPNQVPVPGEGNASALRMAKIHWRPQRLHAQQAKRRWTPSCNQEQRQSSNHQLR
eukprot:2320431-Amphidinium_carterae.1